MARVIAQIGIVGTKIIFKAFVESYRIAAAESAKNAIGATASSISGDIITRKTGLSQSEAIQILNIPAFENNISPEEKDRVRKEIEARYDHLFKTNDPETGGSFYIQSKIVRARERLELEMCKKSKEDDSNLNNEIQSQ